MKVKVDELWTPRLVGELNENYVKLAKGDGELDWHTHENEDKFFLVVSGRLDIHLRDEVISLDPGEFYVVPKGVEQSTDCRRWHRNRPDRTQRNEAHRRPTDRPDRRNRRSGLDLTNNA